MVSSSRQPPEVVDQGFTSYECSFSKLIVASRLSSKAKAVKFVLIHKNHFLQEIGAAFNMPFVIKIEGLANESVRKSVNNVIEWLGKSSEYKLGTYGRDLFYGSFGAYLQNVYSAYVERKKELGDKLQEREIAYLAGIKWVEELQTDAKQSRRFASIVLPMAEMLVPIMMIGMINGFLSMYDRQKRAIGDDYNECIDIWRECDIVEPIFCLYLCPNELCKHYEFLLSSSPMRPTNCTKCGKAWISITSYRVHEPFASLKIAGKDLPVFLSATIRGKISVPIQIFPECYLETKSGGVQVDVFLKELNRIIECKVYEDDLVTTHEKLLNIFRSDCGRLVQTMRKAKARTGYFVTNLKLQDQHLDLLQEEVKRITKGRLVVKIIAGHTVEKFLERLNNYVSEIDNLASRSHMKRLIGKQPTIVEPLELEEKRSLSEETMSNQFR